MPLAAKVLLNHPILEILTYLIPVDLYAKLQCGNLVKIDVKSREFYGVILEIKELEELTLGSVSEKKDYDIKYIKFLIPEIILENSLVEFLKKFAWYNMVSIGNAFKLCIPIDLSYKRGITYIDPLEINLQNFKLPVLNDEQNKALLQIQSSKKTVVLKGVTGSGKTEIYMYLIAEKLKQGGQILVLLPEIALTTQMLERFELRFGFKPIVWNSSIRPASKKRTLHNIINGSARLVLGSRSALMLPYKSLNLIIVDEEHDQSYKQEEGIIYNARDMAILRGHMQNFPVILCSATPSIETYANIEEGKYELAEISSRFGIGEMPQIKIIDLRKEEIEKGYFISSALKAAMESSLAKGYQILLFLNRRGYAPAIICEKCGYKYGCKFCSSNLVYHKSKSKLECHHCGWFIGIKNSCPECNIKGAYLTYGPGVEKIADEVQSLFPGVNLQIVTKDTMNKPEDIASIIKKIDEGEIQIMIGTQVISKGYHFPKLNLVGIIDGDLGLNGGDLKSAERTHQLITQTSGRAGRESAIGEVFIQTYNPDNLLLKAIVTYDEKAFIYYEMQARRESGMPPFYKMASILITGKNDLTTLKFAKEILSIAPFHDSIKILGPAKALMHKLKDKFRYRILVFCEKKYNIQDIIKNWLSQINLPKHLVSIKIDIDPYSLY